MKQSAGAILRKMLALCVAGALMFGFGSTASGAQARDSRAKQAKAACAAGDAAKGDRLLGELYAATQDPIWIFKQGRCLQQNKQPAQALARYQEYLGKAKTAAKDAAATTSIAEAEGYIKELEAAATAENKTPAPSEPAPAGVESPVEQAPPVPAPAAAAAPAAAVAAPAPAAGGGRPGLVVAGVGLEILGAVALVTGGVYSYLVHNTKSDANNMTSDGKVALGSDLKTKQADGDHFVRMQWMFYGIGGAAMATGIALHIIGTPKKAGATTAQILPVIAPSAWGLSLSVGL